MAKEKKKDVKKSLLAVIVMLVLEIGMFSLIFLGGRALYVLFSGEVKEEKMKVYDIKNKIDFLEVDIIKSDLTIKKGDKFEVRSGNKNVKVKTRGNKLVVEEEDKIYKPLRSKVVITIPYELIDVSVENEGGIVNISDLASDEVDFEFTYGKVNINNLISLKETNIECGNGNTIFKDVKLNNLELEGGTADLELTGQITGYSSVDAGMGKIKFNLDDLENYTIKVKDNVGNVKVAGEDAKRKDVFGEGKNVINVSGGVGEVIINFSK